MYMLVYDVREGERRRTSNRQGVCGSMSHPRCNMESLSGRRLLIHKTRSGKSDCWAQVKFLWRFAIFEAMCTVCSTLLMYIPIHGRKRSRQRILFLMNHPRYHFEHLQACRVVGHWTFLIPPQDYLEDARRTCHVQNAVCYLVTIEAFGH